MPSGSAVAAPRMKLFTDTLLKQFIDAHTIPPSDRRILRVRRSEWRDVLSVVALGPRHRAASLVTIWMVYWAHVLRQLHWGCDVGSVDAVSSGLLSFRHPHAK